MRDIANPDTAAQAADVRAVLARIDAGPDSGRTLVEVWNKLDLLDDEARVSIMARALRSQEGAEARAIAVSAHSGEGVERLLELLAQLIDQDEPIEANLPAGDGRAMAWLYRHGRIVDRAEDGEGGVRLSVRLDHQALGRFERLFPEALVRHAAQ